ncbi:hypothetical protein SCFA_200002 [anaerobic digester metagenome]|uniref:Uncharacterized protein n=1 Tax=anaerobic digester metagenome TaxID=1263854 RepID=A0A485LXF3_9ZZZZ
MGAGIINCPAGQLLLIGTADLTLSGNTGIIAAEDRQGRAAFKERPAF